MNSLIVVVGSLNADFVLQVDRFPVAGETISGRKFELFPGGKGANQAFGAARLGARVSLVGQVGGDAEGDWLLNHLASGGVDVTAVRRDRMVSSGVAMITVNGEGQNQIIIVAGANGTFVPNQLQGDRELISRAGFVLLQLEIPMETVEAAATLAKQSGANVILDPAPARPLSSALLQLANYVTPNETELAILNGVAPALLNRSDASRLARQLIGRGARKVIVKMGAQGALLVAGALEYFWPSLPVKAVDTTAAGDAFNAAFAAALSRGETEIKAGHYATAAAACSVSRPGAQPSMPTHREVQAFLGH